MGSPPEILNSSAAAQSWTLTNATDAQRSAMLAWMQEIAPYGVFTVDRDLNIRTWNHWLVTHSGLAAEDLIGRPLIQVFPELVTRRMDQHFRRALEGEVSVLSTALHKYLLALPVAIDVPGQSLGQMLQTARIAPLMLGDHIVGCIATIEDVTQRESQALTLRRQQEHDRLLSSALAVLLESDKPLQAAADLFPRIAAPLKLDAYLNYVLEPGSDELRLYAAGGIPPEVRKSMAVVPLDEGPCKLDAQVRTAVVATHLQSDPEPRYEVLRRLGFHAYVGFPLLVGDRLLGTLSFGSYNRDVIEPDEINFLSTLAQYFAVAFDRAIRESALYDARLRLAQHAESLETKIAERTATLHETIQQLESFSYTIAHDLRAPIRSLKGYAEVLLSDYGESIPRDGHLILHRLQRASSRLDALTRDLLKFSKLVRQDVQLTPVDLSELVDDIVLLTPALQHDVVHVDRPLGSVSAQRTLLQQCLSNLFDNAVKFTAAGVKPRIVVRTEKRAATTTTPESENGLPFHSALRATSSGMSARESSAGPRVRIWIEDNGIGIPAIAHEKIFGIFERGSGLDSIEGTGIGLAIVARAVQQMGGTCGVESAPGQGSRFWLELAAGEPAAA